MGEQEDAVVLNFHPNFDAGDDKDRIDNHFRSGLKSGTVSKA